MLVSEFAHSLKQPNNKVLRENIKLLVLHTRNEVIRRSFENHGFVDRGLVQRFKVSLTNVYDGEIELPEGMEDIDSRVPKVVAPELIIGESCKKR